MTTRRAKRLRTKRINLRATPGQERLIRTGAETTGASLTDFILDSACLQAEHVLADKREFIASPKQWQAFVEALDRPAQIKSSPAFFPKLPLLSVVLGSDERSIERS
jgi:uncharacterized protein (DUF1778 family)